MCVGRHRGPGGRFACRPGWGFSCADWGALVGVVVSANHHGTSSCAVLMLVPPFCVLACLPAAVAIVGRPNVGKSSLLNSLVGRVSRAAGSPADTFQESQQRHIHRMRGAGAFPMTESCAEPLLACLCLALRCSDRRSVPSSAAWRAPPVMLSTQVGSNTSREAVSSGMAAGQRNSLRAFSARDEPTPLPRPHTAGTNLTLSYSPQSHLSTAATAPPLGTTAADLTLTDGRKFTLVDTAGVRKRTAVASSKDGAEVRAPAGPARRCLV
jgi:GTPase SAR1 family protein